MAKDAPPFCKVFEGVVHYFLHDHHLRLEENILYDENKFCEACVMPIIEDEFYSCAECDFILHETCLKARPRIQHALHPHPLTLKATNNYVSSWCTACIRICGGFVYERPKHECYFKLDVSLTFCATLPYKVRYKNDEHFLTLSWGEERCEKYWCEECEDIVEELFYWCNDCCTILHTDCLLSESPYLKPGQVLKVGGKCIKFSPEVIFLGQFAVTV
ncbi:hypothetical protein Bca52824_003893 [Brassica carinata]|uniref:DC1 domain-containing protein n=1 Tax=Brassica carinata TaxID=52824 RepID=A0A8X7WR12_BRACI|nr:hypothetical protein Bca52824_003893 [Brassica carinata]